MKQQSVECTQQFNTCDQDCVQSPVDAREFVMGRLARHKALVAVSTVQIRETLKRQEDSIAVANRSLELVSEAFQKHFDKEAVRQNAFRPELPKLM